MVVTGIPLTELQPLKTLPSKGMPEMVRTCSRIDSNRNIPINSKDSSSIKFVRIRMFYARATLNAKGRTVFGLRHIREFGNVSVLPCLRIYRCPKSIP